MPCLNTAERSSQEADSTIANERGKCENPHQHTGAELHDDGENDDRPSSAESDKDPHSTDDSSLPLSKVFEILSNKRIRDLLMTKFAVSLPLAVMNVCATRGHVTVSFVSPISFCVSCLSFIANHGVLSHCSPFLAWLACRFLVLMPRKRQLAVVCWHPDSCFTGIRVANRLIDAHEESCIIHYRLLHVIVCCCDRKCACMWALWHDWQRRFAHKESTHPRMWFNYHNTLFNAAKGVVIKPLEALFSESTLSTASIVGLCVSFLALTQVCACFPLRRWWNVIMWIRVYTLGNTASDMPPYSPTSTYYHTCLLLSTALPTSTRTATTSALVFN